MKNSLPMGYYQNQGLKKRKQPQKRLKRTNREKAGELFTIFLFFLTVACYLLSETQLYNKLYPLIDYCFRCCFAYCIFACFYCRNWSVTGKLSVGAMFLFNALNFVDKFYFDEKLDVVYFSVFFITITIVLSISTIYELICHWIKYLEKKDLQPPK